MFQFHLPNEKYIQDINLELSKLNRQIAELTAKYNALEELYISMKGRTNRSKKNVEEEEDNKQNNVLVAV